MVQTDGCDRPTLSSATSTVAGMDLCKHEMTPETCGLCTVPPPARVRMDLGAKPFRYIEGTRLFHYRDCREVTWDPAKSKAPGERHDLEPREVRDLVAQGVLERGGHCCGANVGVS